MKYTYLILIILLLEISCKKEDNKENQPPVIQNINCSPNARTAGLAYSLTVLATDPDGDKLQYQWTAEEGEFQEPTNLPQTKWQSPQDGKGKTFTVTVYVSDGKSTANKGFQIKLDANGAPVISRISSTPESAKGGALFSLKVEASDPENDPLTYKWTSDGGIFPDGDDHAVVNWKSPETIIDKKYILKVTVSDRLVSSEQTLEISVRKNAAPVISQMTSTPLSAKAGSIFSLQVAASDPEDDPLSYKWTCDGGEFTDGDIQAIVNWRSPMIGTERKFNIRVAVSDGYNTVDQALEVSVLKNSAPFISQMTSTPVTGEAGSKFTIEVEASDPDNDPLMYVWTYDEIEFSNGDDQSIVIWKSPASNLAKIYALKVTVSDGFAQAEKTLQISVTKSNLSVLKDSRDGKEYETIVIGTQNWMAENLAYLPAVSSLSVDSYTLPYYYVYGYDGSNVSEARASSNYSTYGVLYNWIAARTACPTGWHLPSDEEWKVLEIYLGMSQSDADAGFERGSGSVGKSLKSDSGWNENGNGNNSSGFNALPGGYQLHGNFYGLGYTANFWSASENGSSWGWSRVLVYSYVSVSRFGDSKAQGSSVRCLKN